MGIGGISIWTVMVVGLVALAFFGLVVAALVKYVFGLGKRNANSH
jgi:hypothetical protein